MVKKNVLVWGLIIGLLIIVFILAFEVVDLTRLNSSFTNTYLVKPEQTQNTNTPVVISNIETNVTSTAEVPFEQQDFSLLPNEIVSTTAMKTENLPADIFSQQFTWNEPKLTDKLGVFTAHTSNCGTNPNEFGPGCTSYLEKQQNYYQIASFNYNNTNGKVVMASYGPIDFDFTLEEHYFVVWGNKIYLLTKEGNTPTSSDGLNKKTFVADTTTTLPQPTFTKEINIPEKQKLSFSGIGKISDFWMNDQNKDTTWQYLKPIKIANYEGKDIFDYGDFLVTFTSNLLDIQPIKYAITLPTTIKLDTGKSVSVKNYHTDHLKACGGRTGLNIVRNYTDADLKKVGQTNDSHDIYELKNTADGSEVSEMFKNYNGTQENSNQATTTWDKYISENPILLMKDSFGRYIELTSKKYYVQMAECGKPVIYLYPKQETKVNVQVKPNGGLTKVDPFYPMGGWTVNAKPNGELTNLSDNQKYPYLFWEGKAHDLKIPTDGFMLKKENVKTEMPKILANLGLNPQETSDFMDFWQIKLEERQYVFVTFVSQTDFDQVAPLNILPRPDKVIRVFMDYQPLDYSFMVRPLKIETPIRTGFTVVEWGGRLHQ